MKNETIKMNIQTLNIKTGTIKIKKATGIYQNFTNGTPYISLFYSIAGYTVYITIWFNLQNSA